MEQKQMNRFWDLAKEVLAETLPSGTLDLIFEGVRIQDFNTRDMTVTLVTDSGFKYDSIDNKYRAAVEDAFLRSIGFKMQLLLAFDGEPTDLEKLKRQLTGRDKEEHRPADILFRTQKSNFDDQNDEVFRTGKEIPAEITKDHFYPRSPSNSAFPASCYDYTFSNFIVGSSNKFAHAACSAVADHPATNYNPLFIYGPSGLGKTHLMYAVLNRIRENYPDVNILYIKGEEFTNELVESLKRSAMTQFRNKFRSCDVLLIDDIQFVAGKTSTQEEIFHTFNALYEDHKQIILTSDRPPREIKTLEDRLKTRFEWGLIADIQPPDLELRVAILKKKCETTGLKISDEILIFLAENLRSNIRQLEGVIKKISAMTFLTGDPVSMQTAQACITEFMGNEEPVSVTLDRIFAMVEKKFSVTKDDMIGTRRTKEIAAARHVAVYLIRNITDISLPKIGRIFNRDHTTVISSCEAVERRMLSDSSYNFLVSEMMKSLKNSD